MSNRENNMSESGWTMYLDDSSWTYKDDTTDFEMKHIVNKEESEITTSIEPIDSSMASDASSGPIMDQRRLPSQNFDQSDYSQSYPSRRLQQNVHYEASSSSINKRPQKNTKIRIFDNNKGELLKDTATSSVRTSKRGTLEGEANVQKRALEQIPAESLHGTKIFVEEDTGFGHENVNFSLQGKNGNQAEFSRTVQ